MLEYIYFLKTKDSSNRFKIGSTGVCLNRRYQSLKDQYRDIFDISDSFFMIAPKECNLLELERFLHNHFKTFRIGRAKSEFFRIDVFEQCLLEVARLYKTRGRADDYSWTMHSLADYYERARSDKAQERIKRFIRRGHKHLKPGGHKITAAEYAQVKIQSWYPAALARKLKGLVFVTKRHQGELLSEALEDLLQKYSAEVDRAEAVPPSEARRRKTKAEYAQVKIQSWYAAASARKLRRLVYVTRRDQGELLCEALEDLLQKYSAEVGRAEAVDASEARRRKTKSRPASLVSN